MTSRSRARSNLHASRLAKLSQPHWYAALDRERLFAELDALRSRRKAVFVIGQPGAGKSALVSTWLNNRRLPAIWFHIDPGDADLPTFFHFLREAAPVGPSRRSALSLLGPEYQTDVSGFARRFFRDLFSTLPDDTVLVFDNLHEVAAENALHRLLAEAVEAVPTGMSLILISRHDPPPAFSRAIAGEQVGFVGTRSLQVTAEEAVSIAAARGWDDEALAAQLAARCGGWAAGLTLMLERVEREGGDDVSDPARELEFVFDYFAAQIFAQIAEEDRRTLVMLAYLTRPTARMATDLVGSPRAARLLESLYRRNLFTDRRPGSSPDGPVYQFHALFRDFLRHAGQRILDDEQRADVAFRAAGLAANAARFEDAFALYREAGHWREAVALILNCAPSLIDQGRWRTVVNWVESLPREYSQNHRWLQYWVGTAYMRIDAPTARKYLGAAAQLACEGGDALCEILAMAGMIFAQHIESIDLSHMDAPLERIGALMADGVDLGQPADEAFVLSAIVLGGTRRRPSYPLLDMAASKLLPWLADERLGPNLRIVAAHALVLYAQWGLKRSFGASVIALARCFLQSPDLAPVTKSLFYCATGNLHQLFGQTVDAVRDLDAALEISRRENLVYPQFVALSCKAYAVDFVYCSDIFAPCPVRSHEVARETGVALDVIAASSRDFNRDYYLGHRLWRAFLKGEWDAAFRFGQAAVHAAELHGLAATQMFWSAVMASTSIEAGRLDDVPGWIERGMRAVRGSLYAPWEAPLRFVEAALAERRGDPDLQRECLAAALSVVRRYDCPSILYMGAHLLPRLLGFALREGIEPDTARQVISLLRILPPGEDAPGWPYAAEVSLLGGFDIRLGGTRLDFPGKLPRQPLALLKALVCLGGRNGAPVDRLTDSLWPDSEADAARRSFKVALHRLRQLLGDPTLVRLDGGVLSLDRGRVWVDCWAFEAAARGCTDDNVVMEPRVAALYRGLLLPGDTSAPWTVSARENLRGLFNDWVVARGRAFEHAGRWEDAMAFYRSAIERDDLVEAFYQGWMRGLASLGRRAECAAVLERLRRTLALKLSVLPAPETLAILR
jgi:LuxR family maltose regulon positive regulatory protein